MASTSCRIELTLEGEGNGAVSLVKGEGWEAGARGQRDRLCKGTEAKGSMVRRGNCKWFTLAWAGCMKGQHERLHRTCPWVSCTKES